MAAAPLPKPTPAMPHEFSQVVVSRRTRRVLRQPLPFSGGDHTQGVINDIGQVPNGKVNNYCFDCQNLSVLPAIGFINKLRTGFKRCPVSAPQQWVPAGV